MSKYYEVAVWYYQQHHLMCNVMALCLAVIALMWYEAERQLKRDVIVIPEIEDEN